MRLSEPPRLGTTLRTGQGRPLTFKRFGKPRTDWKPEGLTLVEHPRPDQSDGGAGLSPRFERARGEVTLWCGGGSQLLD